MLLTCPVLVVRHSRVLLEPGTSFVWCAKARLSSGFCFCNEGHSATCGALHMSLQAVSLCTTAVSWLCFLAVQLVYWSPLCCLIRLHPGGTCIGPGVPRSDMSSWHTRSLLLCCEPLLSLLMWPGWFWWCVEPFFPCTSVHVICGCRTRDCVMMGRSSAV